MNETKIEYEVQYWHSGTWLAIRIFKGENAAVIFIEQMNNAMPDGKHRLIKRTTTEEEIS